MMTSSAQTSNPAVERAIERIGNRLDASPLVLLLDIDGTLAPIASTPALAQVPAATHFVLERLVQLPGVVIALVSGRSAHDAARIAALPGAWVIGNHGYELMSPDGEIAVWPAAAEFEASMAEAARMLAPIEIIEGALLENKRWTLSVHYRNVRNGPADLENRVRSVAADLGLRVTDGKKVIEVRPPIDVDKGTAALAFALRHDAVGASAVLYAGDDRTDEDAFRALRPSGRAVTVRIDDDDTIETGAEFTLPSPAELHDLLGWLAQRRLEKS
jgi:trehalose-phosphatase